MADDGFVFVKSRRKKWNKSAITGDRVKQEEPSNEACHSDVDRAVFERRLYKTRLDIACSAAVSHILEQVRLWCLHYQTSRTADDKSTDGISADENLYGGFNIVCYGLGNFMSSIESREQLVCLQELQKLQRPSEGYRCYCFDPRQTVAEGEYLTEHGCSLIDRNEEGKRGADGVTVFFMPHCGKALFNNLLWANWRPSSLTRMLVIGNSFSAMKERTADALLRKEYQFIDKILPYTHESLVPVDASTLGAFSDTAIMYFPNLPDVTEGRSDVTDGRSDVTLWTDCAEPVYCEQDVEIIRDR